MEKKSFEDEINLVWLFYALLKRIWLIIIVAVIFACGTATYTYFRIKPTYTSTSTMLVLTKETTLTSLADLQLGSQLTKDYTVLIASRPVLEEVIVNLDLDMNYKQLRQKVAFENPEDTRILKISVTYNDAKIAKTIVDELAVVASDFIADKMEVSPPKIIEEGEVSGTKTGPNMSKNALIGFIAGAVLVCVIVVIMELMDDSIQTEEDIEKYLEVPMLALVPNKANSKDKEKKSDRKGSKLWRTKV